MTEHLPRPSDDRENFERHPDIRTLETPNATYLELATAATAETIAEAPEILDLTTVEPGTRLRITGVLRDGTSHVTEFTRKTDESPMPWAWNETTDDGEQWDEPAYLSGSVYAGSSMIRPGVACKGLELEYEIIHTMQVKSGAEMPEGSPWGRMPDASELTEALIAFNMRDGLLQQTADGLVWNFPVDRQAFTTGIISGIEVIPGTEADTLPK